MARAKPVPRKTVPDKATVAELQQLLRSRGEALSKKSIYGHLGRTGMRLDENHKVDVSEFLRNMTANQEMDKRNLSGVDDPGSGQSSNPARVRIYLQCLLLRHEYDLRRGEVLNKADVVRTLTLAAQNARDKLLAIPDILMVAGMPSEYRKVVDDSVRKVLDEYAKELTEATLT